MQQVSYYLQTVQQRSASAVSQAGVPGARVRSRQEDQAAEPAEDRARFAGEGQAVRGVTVG